MDKISWLWKEPDKRKHIVLGLAAAGFGVVVALAYVAFGFVGAILVSGLGVSIGYELNQKIRGEGEPSVRDAVATFIGSLVAAAVASLFAGG